MVPDFERELGANLVEYRALQKICSGAPANSVLGEALDAAAETLAVHIATLPDKHDLTAEYMELFFDIHRQRFGVAARDSVALAPVLVWIDAKADPGDFLIEQNRYEPQRGTGTPQTLADAELDLRKLFAVIGEGEMSGDVFFAAKVEAEYYIDNFKNSAQLSRLDQRQE